MSRADIYAREIEESARFNFRHELSQFKEQVERLKSSAQYSRFLLNEKTMLRHMLILGSTGSGKTNHAFDLIIKAMKENPSINCVVVDGKREYRKLGKILEGKVDVLSIGGEPKVRFNPLAPPDETDAAHWDRAFADVFTRAYGLSEPSRRILLDSLFELTDKQGESHPAGAGKESRRVRGGEPQGACQQALAGIEAAHHQHRAGRRVVELRSRAGRG